MARYARKPSAVNAEPYCIGMEDGFDKAKDATSVMYIPNYKLPRGCSSIYPYESKYPYIITPEDDKVYISEGDFIVTDEKGGKYAYNGELFDKHYQIEEVYSGGGADEFLKYISRMKINSPKPLYVALGYNSMEDLVKHCKIDSNREPSQLIPGLDPIYGSFALKSGEDNYLVDVVKVHSPEGCDDYVSRTELIDNGYNMDNYVVVDVVSDYGVYSPVVNAVGDRDLVIMVNNRSIAEMIASLLNLDSDNHKYLNSRKDDK